MSREELLEVVKGHAEGGIRITFSGKELARRIARRVQPRTVKRLAQYSIGSAEDEARNLVIEGENLQAMATLYRERGQVDMILADPPYNTGNDFRYNDRWDEDPNDPDLGKLVPEDDGARRTKWLRFMWPRLAMMREMLKPTGVLAICIDHRELFRLGQVLDELFGEQNRIGVINWQKSYSPRNDNKHISTATEYVLVYARDLELAATGLLDRTESMDARYSNPDRDPEGDWRPDNPCAKGSVTHPGMVYGIQNPFTGEVQYPPEGTHWRSEKAKIKAWLEVWGTTYEARDLDDGCPSSALVLRGAKIRRTASGAWGTPTNDRVLNTATKRARSVLKKGPWPQLYFAKDGKGRPNMKRYMNRLKKGVVPMSYWADDDYDAPFLIGCTSWDHEESGHSQTGINELDAIVGPGHGFSTVKPLKLFWKIIQLWCPPSGLVLDPFAGSGTTGHAVLGLNATTESSRRFILIEQGRPDRGDSYARSLTANRLRRVVTGDWANGKGEPLGEGFKFCALQKKIDAGAVLEMERDEMTDAVIASHFDASQRGASSLVLLTRESYRFLVARNTEGEGFYLVWEGPKRQPLFDQSVYEKVVEEAVEAGLKPFYHVYARFNLYQSQDVKFYQIPDRILMDFGLSMSTDAFNDVAT